MSFFALLCGYYYFMICSCLMLVVWKNSSCLYWQDKFMIDFIFSYIFQFSDESDLVTSSLYNYRCKDEEMLHDGQCVSDCGRGFYASGGSCHPCHASCSECAGPDSNQCQVCPVKTFLHAGTCNEACPRGYYARWLIYVFMKNYINFIMMHSTWKKILTVWTSSLKEMLLYIMKFCLVV